MAEALPIEEIHPGEPLPAALGARRAPCVMRGVAAGWAARARWTPAALRAAWAGGAAPVARLDAGGRLATDARRGLDLSSMPVEDFFAGLERGAPAYLMAPLTALPPALRADIEIPPPCRGAPWLSSKLWVSPAGAVSPLHFDIAHNLHAQLHGRKRFLVLLPGQWASLYPEPPWSGVPNFSRVDPVRPDLGRFPRFARAARYACTLEPGDVVFLPSRAWHHVTTKSTSVSLNFWWARGPLALAARAADRLKQARGVSR